MPSGTMHAIRAHHRGGAEGLVYETVPIPEPRTGEVLLKVHAAGVTMAELSWDATWTTSTGADRTPIIPSHEVSGTVVHPGSAAATFRTGDEVYGLIDFHHDGAAAEYATVAADALARPSRRLSPVQAAALVMPGLTAWQALVDHGRLQPGQHVLIQGGAGGVGSLAVQLARYLGAHVTATAAPHAHDVVSKLGADVVVDYPNKAVKPPADGFDLLLDTFGGPTFGASYQLVRPEGRLVTLSQPPDHTIAVAQGIEAVFFVVHPDPGQLRHLTDLADLSQIAPVIAQTFPLADGRKAFTPQSGTTSPGKRVLRIAT